MHLVSVARLRIMIAVLEVLFLNHEPPSHQKTPELVLPKNDRLERVLAQTPKLGAFTQSASHVPEREKNEAVLFSDLKPSQTHRFSPRSADIIAAGWSVLRGQEDLTRVRDQHPPPPPRRREEETVTSCVHWLET